MDVMKAVVFRGPNRIAIEERPKPEPRAGEAILEIAMTTMCGTDVHIVKGEYPVKPGLILGRVPIGVIRTLGEGLEGEYHVGQRVLAGAVTPCGQCFYCLNGAHSQCQGPAGGWKFGNTIDGSWAEFLRVPDARANLAPIPELLTDEDVMLVPDIFSAGVAAVEGGNVQIGDTVAIFAQGPAGLCATLGARLRGAGLIIAVDHVEERLEMARRFGANVLIDYTQQDAVAVIRRLTEGRGADVCIEALGSQQTFENALSALRPGGTVSSLGLYSGKLVAPFEPLYGGLGNKKIVTTLCPGGKERMRRLMAMISNHRVDLSPLVTHRFGLDDIHTAYDIFSSHRDGVLKVALTPHTPVRLPNSEEVGVDVEC